MSRAGGGARTPWAQSGKGVERARAVRRIMKNYWSGGSLEPLKAPLVLDDCNVFVVPIAAACLADGATTFAALADYKNSRASHDALVLAQTALRALDAVARRWRKEQEPLPDPQPNPVRVYIEILRDACGQIVEHRLWITEPLVSTRFQTALGDLAASKTKDLDDFGSFTDSPEAIARQIAAANAAAEATAAATRPPQRGGRPGGDAGGGGGGGGGTTRIATPPAIHTGPLTLFTEIGHNGLRLRAIAKKFVAGVEGYAAFLDGDGAPSDLVNVYTPQVGLVMASPAVRGEQCDIFTYGRMNALDTEVLFTLPASADILTVDPGMWPVTAFFSRPFPSTQIAVYDLKWLGGLREVARRLTQIEARAGGAPVRRVDAAPIGTVSGARRAHPDADAPPARATRARMDDGGEGRDDDDDGMQTSAAGDAPPPLAFEEDVLGFLDDLSVPDEKPPPLDEVDGEQRMKNDMLIAIQRLYAIDMDLIDRAEEHSVSLAGIDFGAGAVVETYAALRTVHRRKIVRCYEACYATPYSDSSPTFRAMMAAWTERQLAKMETHVPMLDEVRSLLQNWMIAFSEGLTRYFRMHFQHVQTTTILFGLGCAFSRYPQLFINFMVTGNGGTGKSFMLNVISILLCNTVTRLESESSLSNGLNGYEADCILIIEEQSMHAMAGDVHANVRKAELTECITRRVVNVVRPDGTRKQVTYVFVRLGPRVVNTNDSDLHTKSVSTNPFGPDTTAHTEAYKSRFIPLGLEQPRSNDATRHMDKEDIDEEMLGNHAEGLYNFISQTMTIHCLRAFYQHLLFVGDKNRHPLVPRPNMLACRRVLAQVEDAVRGRHGSLESRDREHIRKLAIQITIFDAIIKHYLVPGVSPHVNRTFDMTTLLDIAPVCTTEHVLLAFSVKFPSLFAPGLAHFTAALRAYVAANLESKTFIRTNPPGAPVDPAGDGGDGGDEDDDVQVVNAEQIAETSPGVGRAVARGARARQQRHLYVAIPGTRASFGADLREFMNGDARFSVLLSNSTINACVGMLSNSQVTPGVYKTVTFDRSLAKYTLPALLGDGAATDSAQKALIVDPGKTRKDARILIHVRVMCDPAFACIFQNIINAISRATTIPQRVLALVPDDVHPFLYVSIDVKKGTAPDFDQDCSKIAPGTLLSTRHFHPTTQAANAANAARSPFVEHTTDLATRAIVAFLTDNGLPVTPEAIMARHWRTHIVAAADYARALDAAHPFFNYPDDQAAAANLTGAIVRATAAAAQIPAAGASVVRHEYAGNAVVAAAAAAAMRGLGAPLAARAPSALLASEDLTDFARAVGAIPRALPAPPTPADSARSAGAGIVAQFSTLDLAPPPAPAPAAPGLFSGRGRGGGARDERPVSQSVRASNRAAAAVGAETAAAIEAIYAASDAAMCVAGAVGDALVDFGPPEPPQRNYNAAR